MSGTVLTTVSPSRVTISRSTPCVEGCCGPMLMVMVSTRLVSPTLTLSVMWSSVCSPSCIACILARLLARFWFVARGSGWAALVDAHCLAANALRQCLLEWYLSAPMRFRQFDAGQWIVFAQRVAGPVLWHNQTTQVRVTGKGDTKDIVDLALVPVGSGPDSADGGN